jgi:hypothetical protein
MPAATPKPFVRRGITFASQYAYRQFLAAEKGYPSKYAREQEVARLHARLDRYTSALTKAERGELIAGVADYKGLIGSYVQGIDPARRGSNRLPDRLVELIKRLGPDAYPIWRTLYR